MARINRGVNSPINCLNSSLLANLHVAPHTGAHVAVCGLRATWPHPVRLLRGPPGCCHVASVSRRNNITWAHYTPGPITCQLKDRLATWCPQTSAWTRMALPSVRATSPPCKRSRGCAWRCHVALRAMSHLYGSHAAAHQPAVPAGK